MQFFLDSIDIHEIEKYNNYGIIAGITTNPSLIAKAKTDFKGIIAEICKIVEGSVSVEVAANDFEYMVKEGDELTKIADNIAVKIPMTWDGIRACKYFANKGIKVNMTLCFSANQALLAAKAGAEFISPFIGRLEDIGEDGIGLVADIRTIYDNYNLKTKILAASIRNPEHVVEAAVCGADIATMPGNIMSELVSHDLTSKGLQKFNADWSKSGLKIL
ncbi:MAG: fructose-6-phosphate aldolase [Rickettsiaceae bacterium]|nr:fructose-6-phosphate aldolase [Rickettsiaceae bacterium]